MKEPLTLEKALQEYMESSDEKRAAARRWSETAAQMHPEPETRELNRALLKAFAEIDGSGASPTDGRIERAKEPPMPTPAETNAVLLWGFGLLAKIAGGLVVIFGGMYLAGAAVAGLGTAIQIWAVSNAVAIGWVFAAVLAVVGIGALPRWKGGQEEREAGETPVKIQNIVNNIYISQSQEGDVVVNSEKNGH